MDKLLNILPYIYLDEPVQLGKATFLGVPDWKGRDHAPSMKLDKECLQEISAYFPTIRGLEGNRKVTYFLLENEKGKETETLEQARKAITLLRYAMLHPDARGLDNVESTYIYAIALPHSGKDDYHLYQCWPNLNVDQETWISAKYQRFQLPGWQVDFKWIHISQLQDLEKIRQRFYGEKKLDKEDEILLAMDWYNQSFLKYTLRSVAGRLVDVATAFETLFQLPRNNKTAEFKQRIEEYLGADKGSVLDNWAGDFYSKVRSEIVHKGRPLSYLFKHPEAQTSHLSFLWSSWRIFRESISAKLGLPRHIDNDRLTEELTPNEIHLSKLKKAGCFESILESNLLEEVWRLKKIYPAGKREDIIWLGKELLRGYREQYKSGERNPGVLEQILDSDDTGLDLGLKYSILFEQFKQIHLKAITVADIKQFDLKSVILHFADFATWALMMPTPPP